MLFLFGVFPDGVPNAYRNLFVSHNPRSVYLLCLQWARDEFEGLFKQPAENVDQYLMCVGLSKSSLTLSPACQSEHSVTSVTLRTWPTFRIN